MAKKPKARAADKCQVHLRLPAEMFERLERYRKLRKDSPKRTQILKEALALYLEREA